MEVPMMYCNRQGRQQSCDEIFVDKHLLNKLYTSFDKLKIRAFSDSAARNHWVLGDIGREPRRRQNPVEASLSTAETTPTCQ